MPKQSSRSRIPQLVTAGVILLLLLLPASALAQQTAPTADWPDCKFQCTANDVNLTGFWLGDESGNPLPNTCTPGDPVTAYIWASFHSTTTSDRYSVILLAEIWVNNALEHSFYNDSPAGFCSLDSIAGGGDSSALIYGQGGSFTWTCGDVVEVRNSIVSWDTNASTCATAERTCAARGTSKCGSWPTIVVEAPLIANFSGGPTCLGTATQFTNKTTGGKTPYANAWNFGDSDTSTEDNPSHTYAATGNYDVTLQVTDAEAPPVQDSQTWPVSIWGNPTAAFDFMGAQKWQYQFSNQSAAATDNGCPEMTPLSYLWSFGDNTTSTETDPLHTFPDTSSQYNVQLTTTDACGCADTTQQTVKFGPNAVTLRSFSAAAGRAPVAPIAGGMLVVGMAAAAGALWRRNRK
jgi:PKD repeat protein